MLSHSTPQILQCRICETRIRQFIFIETSNVLGQPVLEILLSGREATRRSRQYLIQDGRQLLFTLAAHLLSWLLLLRLLLQLVLYLPHTQEDDVTTLVNYATMPSLIKWKNILTEIVIKRGRVGG
jgi:hypothetical protein